MTDNTSPKPRFDCVDRLSHAAATDIVQRIVDVMYLDFDQEGDYYSPDKPLDGAEFIESVTTILNEYGLIPSGSER